MTPGWPVPLGNDKVNTWKAAIHDSAPYFGDGDSITKGIWQMSPHPIIKSLRTILIEVIACLTPSILSTINYCWPSMRHKRLTGEFPTTMAANIVNDLMGIYYHVRLSIYVTVSSLPPHINSASKMCCLGNHYVPPHFGWWAPSVFYFRHDSQ